MLKCFEVRRRKQSTEGAKSRSEISCRRLSDGRRGSFQKVPKHDPVGQNGEDKFTLRVPHPSREAKTDRLHTGLCSEICKQPRTSALQTIQKGNASLQQRKRFLLVASKRKPHTRKDLSCHRKSSPFYCSQLCSQTPTMCMKQK